MTKRSGRAHYDDVFVTSVTSHHQFSINPHALSEFPLVPYTRASTGDTGDSGYNVENTADKVSPVIEVEW